MSNIEIIPYDPKLKAQWDELVDNSRNGTFLLRRDYMDYHSDRFADCSLTAWVNGRLRALLPANREGDVVWSHHGLTYGGWVMPLRHFDPAVMLHIMEQACQWLRGHGARQLVYKPVPYIYHSYPADDDIYALFRMGARLTECNISSTIGLAQPIPFNRGAKSSVNQALRAGVEVGESDDWEGFWAILTDVLAQRHNAVPVHTVSEIELLHSRFPRNIRLYAATLGGQMVAGVVMYHTPLVAHSQYTAAAPLGRQNKALDLLYQRLIEQAQARGQHYFDFGSSNEDHGRVLNEGLLQQKCLMGGRGVAYNTFTIDL